MGRKLFRCLEVLRQMVRKGGSAGEAKCDRVPGGIPDAVGNGPASPCRIAPALGVTAVVADRARAAGLGLTPPAIGGVLGPAFLRSDVLRAAVLRRHQLGQRRILAFLGILGQTQLLGSSGQFRLQDPVAANHSDAQGRELVACD